MIWLGSESVDASEGDANPPANSAAPQSFFATPSFIGQA
jgi:hypothetical protein